MGNHTIKYLAIGNTDPIRHQAVCQCRWRSDQYENKQMVEDEVRFHHNHIEKIRSYLTTSTPSLKQQRDYYRSMAEASDTNEHDRVLWSQLAAELDHRVNDRPIDQPALDWFSN